MALRVESVLTDDRDGGPAHETVLFSLDGDEYEIDLSRANARELREVLGAYIVQSRRLLRPEHAGVVLHKVEAPYDSRAVRAWAAARGIALPARGRIPDSVIDDYRAAGY